MSDLTIRRYRTDDKASCLDIFDSNIPKYFDPGERADFASYLDAPSGHYLIGEIDGRLITCGGWGKLPDRSTATLVYGMVHSDYHGTGIGKKMLERRLSDMAKVAEIKKVTLDTSQHVAGFFERFGFVETSVEPNAYGPGLHRHDMILRLPK
jgi:N-acetylglutamate synthase-like GNAT family acetyltransferase